MWFLAIWSATKGFIGLIPSFVWKWLAIGVAILCIFFYGQARGTRVERAVWEQRVKESNTAAKDQDLQAEKEGRAQDLEITNALVEKQKVDDATIEKLKAQLAQRPTGAQCLYDKSNADPDAPAGRVRVPVPAPRPRTGNKKSS